MCTVCYLIFKVLLLCLSRGDLHTIAPGSGDVNNFFKKLFEKVFGAGIWRFPVIYDRQRQGVFLTLGLGVFRPSRKKMTLSEPGHRPSEEPRGRIWLAR